MGPEHNPADDQPADREEYEQWERRQKEQQAAERIELLKPVLNAKLRERFAGRYNMSPETFRTMEHFIQEEIRSYLPADVVVAVKVEATSETGVRFDCRFQALSPTASIPASNREMDLFELGDSQYDDPPEPEALA